jgi:hypothetical protein
MNNLKRTWTTDYTVVSNTLINCFGVHPMTRFLCIFLSAQSDNFQFNNAILCRALDCTDATLRKYMKEAIELSLIDRTRKTVNGKFGYFDYELIDPTTLQNLPTGKKTKVVKNQGGKNVRLNKEELSNKEEKNNKEEATPAIAALSPLDADSFIARHSAPKSDPDHFGTEGLPTFEGGTENDYASVYGRIAEHLNGSSDWKGIAGLAKCTMTGEEFKEELQAWIRHFMNKQHLYKKPVQSLRGGPISFINWLRKPWAQDKYNPATKAKQSKLRKGGPVRRTITTA